MIRPVPPFAAATLAPIPLLALGGLFGGVFILAAVLYMTALRFALDALISTAGTSAAPGTEFPAAEPLSKALAIAHFPLLAIGVAGLSGATGLGLWEGLGVFLAFGMYFGQVSNSNAHELIHRTDKRLHQLGKWVLISLLYGHHATAHLRIHHRYVGTPDDPNTAALGEGFYAFARRAWVGAFHAGWEIEKSLAEVKGEPLPFWRHPYAEHVAGGLGFAAAATLAFGPSGLVAFLLLAAYAQIQLLLSDYVQHYGLRRRKIDDDRYEQVAPWHSWNAPHWFSGGLMLNAPRHSEHHTNPARPFPELALPDHTEGPRLPHSLPVMGAIALVPPLWRRQMDRRAAAWQRRIDEGLILRSRSPALLPASRKAPKAEAAEPAANGAPAQSLPPAPARQAPAEAPAETPAAREAKRRTAWPWTRRAAPQDAEAAEDVAGPVVAAAAAGPVAAAAATPEEAGAETEAERPERRRLLWPRKRAGSREAADAAPPEAETGTEGAAAAGVAAAKAPEEEPEDVTRRVSAALAAPEARAPEPPATPEPVPAPPSAEAEADSPEDILRKLVAFEGVTAAPEPAAAPAPAASARTSALWSETEDEDEPDAGDAPPAPAAAEVAQPPRFIRSSALFQPEPEDEIEAETGEPGPDPELASFLESAREEPQGGAGAAPPEDRDTSEPPQELRMTPPPEDQGMTKDAAGGELDVDHAIAQMVSGERRHRGLLRRAALPKIDTGEAPGPEPLGRRIRRLARDARWAALGVAAILGGAPPRPPEE